MTELTDAGPLIALIDSRDDSHAACRGHLQVLPRGSELLSTWAAFTEAMHILGRRAGFHYQADLWAMREAGLLTLTDLTEAEIDRAAALMTRYADRPMDLADATLVAIAEGRGYRRVFTVDSDFRIDRLGDGTSLEIVPA